MPVGAMSLLEVERPLRRLRRDGAWWTACPSPSTAARRWRWSGESGSGKSLTALSLLQLLPPAAATRTGSILLDGDRA